MSPITKLGGVSFFATHVNSSMKGEDILFCDSCRLQYERQIYFVLGLIVSSIDNFNLKLATRVVHSIKFYIL